MIENNKNTKDHAVVIIRGDNMAVCYKKLWKTLIDKDMIKKDLRLQTGFSTTTMSKLSKNENVSMDVIEKIPMNLSLLYFALKMLRQSWGWMQSVSIRHLPKRAIF